MCKKLHTVLAVTGLLFAVAIVWLAIGGWCIRTIVKPECVFVTHNERASAVSLLEDINVSESQPRAPYAVMGSPSRSVLRKVVRLSFIQTESRRIGTNLLLRARRDSIFQLASPFAYSDLSGSGTPNVNHIKADCNLFGGILNREFFLNREVLENQLGTDLSFSLLHLLRYKLTLFFSSLSREPRSSRGVLLRDSLFLDFSQRVLKLSPILVQGAGSSVSRIGTGFCRFYHFMPLVIGHNGIDDDCDESGGLKCAYDISPHIFWFATLGFCLYLYGYVSAKVGHGNWFSLVAFFFGFPMCVYGIFKILETISDLRHSVS